MLGISQAAGANRMSRCKKSISPHGVATEVGATHAVALAHQSKTEAEDALNAVRTAIWQRTARRLEARLAAMHASSVVSLAISHESVLRLVSEATTEAASSAAKRVTWRETAPTHRHRTEVVDVEAVAGAEPAINARRKATWPVTVQRLAATTTETRVARTSVQEETTTAASKLRTTTHGALLTSKRMAGVLLPILSGEAN